MKYFDASLRKCNLCPRACHVDRSSGKTGFCGQSARVRAGRAALHMWEEPCISGKSGSGTVFFSGCTLKCVFCQNHSIAEGNVGKEIETQRLAEIYLELQEQGANNINLVTPDQFIPQIIHSIEASKRQGLKLPFVYNTGSYVETDSIRALEGLIDIYLPDLKYAAEETAAKYACAPNYFKKASCAIAEMVRQTGEPVFFDRNNQKAKMTAEEYNDYAGDGEILLQRGTIVRHLLLPGQEKDSRRIIEYLCRTYGTRIYISILNQFTPIHHSLEYKELDRKITEKEYEAIVDFAIACGIENGFIQEGDSAQESFIPDFSGQGI